MIDLPRPFSNKSAISGLSAVLVGCLLATLGCSRPVITPLIRVGPMDIEGKIGASPPGPGSARASADSMGLDKDRGVFQPRIDLDWDKLHASIEAFKAEYDGDGTATAAFDLGAGGGIEIGRPIRSDMAFTLFLAEATYEILPIPFVDFSLGLGVGLLDYEIEIASKETPARIATDEDLPFAYLTARLGKQFNRFAIATLLRGIDIEYGDEDLSYYEFDVSGTYRLFEREGLLEAHLMVGYRKLFVDYEYDDQGAKVIADLDFDGPFLGAHVRF